MKLDLINIMRDDETSDVIVNYHDAIEICGNKIESPKGHIEFLHLKLIVIRMFCNHMKRMESYMEFFH